MGNAPIKNIGGTKMVERKVEPESNFWKPEKEGEELKGNIKEFIEDGDYGLQAVILTEDNKEITTPSHKMLQSRLKQLKEGDVIRIVMTGEEPPSVKGRNPTKLYDVFVDET
jgi:hypothetical protein